MVKVLSVNGKIPLVDGKAISATGGGSTVELDTTLSEAGKAADAKAVGDALAGKQNTISDLEAIRSGASKGATALQSVPSTYRTASAQDTIDNGKVDKVTGKGLSSNDYTDAAKAKVDALAPVATSGNYNDLTNKPTIPTALPNPHKLTINGTEYDGSADVQMTIEGGGGSVESVQSDWNQNDSMAADYVKNRPFYTGDPVETVLVEESTVSFALAGGLYRAEFPSIFSATIGETYKVSWDGTIYECICVDFGGAPVIGNVSIVGAGSDTGEPFVMAVMNGRGIEFYTADTSVSHTFSISGIIAQVVKVNTKYLPELPYMGKVNPTGIGSFSLNRKANTMVGENSFAEGEGTTASGDASHAEGDGTTASGDASHAEGDGTIASGLVAHAEGFYSKASARFSHAEGCHTIVSDTEIDMPNNSVEDGLGSYGHAEGFGTLVTGQHGAHAEGCKTLSSGSASHSEGYSTTASGWQSHSEGYSTVASGAQSHAEGNSTVASGRLSHAEGENTTASEETSHAEGFYSKASARFSHAEGHSTTASGEISHAEGCKTLSSGSASHSEGYSTVASSNYQHVQGKYNIEDSSNTYAHIVGNGNSDDERSNAHTLDWSGNAWFAGTVEGMALIIPSSTEGSTKKFKITVDDSGTLSATEVTA